MRNLNLSSVASFNLQACGLSDLSDLVTHFCQLESLNFHMFDACNAVNLRVQGLQKKLQNAQV
jgi:hypothetical protein